MSENPERRRVRRRRGSSSLNNAQDRETSLLGILRTEPRFRWALAVLVLFGLAVGGMLPKVWQTSPPDFTPVIKVSGLDFLQARSLRSAAARHAEAGESMEALQSWTAAIANNLGDADAFRSVLRYSLGMPKLESRWAAQTLQQAGWLLRLTKTNQADLELSCAVFQRNDLHETVARLLGDTNRVLSAQGAGMLAKSLFELGRMEEFGTLWEKRKAELASQPEAAVYRDAWGAAWGPPAGMPAALKALSDATSKAELATNALRLQLAVQAQRMDPDGFQDTFQRLQSIRADRLTDHVRRWLLLDFLGKRAQAVELARNYVTPPQSVAEAEVLLRVWGRLGLYELAVDFTATQMDSFQNSPQLWLLLSRMLMMGQKWDDLRTVAVKLRNNGRLGRLLGGYSYYLEGVAEHGAGFPSRAEDAFRKLVKDAPDDSMLTFEAATVVQKLGYPEPARELYRRLEKEMGDKLVFWQQMARAAHDTHETGLLVAACEKAHQLQPNNLVLANNHAAALLIGRTNAAEAVTLTLEVLGKAPDSPIARINHALALAQAGRFTDAEAQVAKLEAATLDEQEQTFLHMARLDALAGLGRNAEAQRELERVELRFLFPQQLEWVAQMRVRLGMKAAPSGQ